MCCTLLLTFGLFLLSVSAETFYGPGTITIATNEAILINSMRPPSGAMFVDDTTNLFFGSGSYASYDYRYGQRYAIAGPHTLIVSSGDSDDEFWMTFQRLQGSSIHTIIAKAGTNTVNIASGKTLQFFPIFGKGSNLKLEVHPTGSTNTYLWTTYNYNYIAPSFAGPACLNIIVEDASETDVVSFYFTDEILQLPPSGLLNTPSPSLEINVEKSQNLKDWTPVSAFNTEAEAISFYRLRILK